MTDSSYWLLRSERWLHFALSILMVLFLALAFFLKKQVTEWVNAVTDDRTECVNLLISESEIKEAVSVAIKKKGQLENECQSTLDLIPDRIVDSEVMSAVRGIAQSSSCSLIDFRPTETQKLSDFQTRSFAMHIEGPFKNAFQFFESFPKVPFVYQISRFKIMEPNTTGGPCRIDLEFKIVFDHVWAKAG
jgi:hypothetical protein